MMESQTMCVKIGHHVRLRLLYRSGDCEELEFDIVPDEISTKSDGFLGASTPLAQAILNEKVGITIPYFTEEIMGITILNISPGEPSQKEIQKKSRRVTQEEIRDQIEFREAQLFALSGNTKWGSYDPDSMDFGSWTISKKVQDQNEEDEAKD
jgi:hypothetical protein